LPEARPPRGRIHTRDSCCRCRTSLSQRSSNPDNVGRLEAASIPCISFLRRYSTPSGAGRVLPLPPRLAVGFGSKGYPTRLRRDSPQEVVGPPFPRGIRHSQLGSHTSADTNCGFIIYFTCLLVNVLCSFSASSHNQRIDAVAPPSTWMVVPVICRAGSDARNTTKAATSFAVPMWPRGMRLFSSATTSS